MSVFRKSLWNGDHLTGEGTPKDITHLDRTRFGPRKIRLFEMPFLLVELGEESECQ